MSRLGARRASRLVAVGFLVAACSAAPAASGPSGTPGATAGGGGTGGDLSRVDACSLLTPAEVQQAFGIAVGKGVNQDSDIVRQCEWDSQAATVGFSFGVTVRKFDQGLWQTVASFPKAVTVSGMGDAAYRNSPLTGDLSVKHDGYEIDMGAANFTTMTQAQVDQATDSLMRLVLSRT